MFRDEKSNNLVERDFLCGRILNLFEYRVRRAENRVAVAVLCDGSREHVLLGLPRG